MSQFKSLVAGWVLTIVASLGFNVAVSTPSLATSIYTFTFTPTDGKDSANQIEITAHGSFSIPVNDFGGNPATVPNADISALSFLGVSNLTFYNTNPGSASFATADVVTSGGSSIAFTYVGGVPQVASGLGTLAQNPSGHELDVNFIGAIFFSFQGTASEALAEVPGTWATTTSDLTATPLPAALPLFASGVSLLGWTMRRRKQRLAA